MTINCGSHSEGGKAQLWSRNDENGYEHIAMHYLRVRVSVPRARVCASPVTSARRSPAADC
jgi:hypothetical protein